MTIERINEPVSAEAKEKLRAYMKLHGLSSQASALDEILCKLQVTSG